MGASICVAEFYIQSLNFSQGQGSNGYLNKRIKFINIRFGNVLESYGFNVSRFKSQIENGGSIKIMVLKVIAYPYNFVERAIEDPINLNLNSYSVVKK